MGEPGGRRTSYFMFEDLSAPSGNSIQGLGERGTEGKEDMCSWVGTVRWVPVELLERM